MNEVRMDKAYVRNVIAKGIELNYPFFATNVCLI